MVRLCARRDTGHHLDEVRAVPEKRLESVETISIHSKTHIFAGLKILVRACGDDYVSIFYLPRSKHVPHVEHNVVSRQVSDKALVANI